MDGQLPGEAGAAGTSLGPLNPQQIERRVDSTCRGRRITRRPRHEISSRKRKKANRSLEDGWLFFFVPIVAEAVSVLKEAG